MSTRLPFLVGALAVLALVVAGWLPGGRPAHGLHLALRVEGSGALDVTPRDGSINGRDLGPGDRVALSVFATNRSGTPAPLSLRFHGRPSDADGLVAVSLRSGRVATRSTMSRLRRPLILDRVLAPGQRTKVRIRVRVVSANVAALRARGVRGTFELDVRPERRP